MGDTPARTLPQPDLTAILDVLVSVGARLATDELDPPLADRLGRRLKKHGAIENITPGELNAVISDLCRRVHWAMGSGTDYPAAVRATVYRMSFGEEQAARDVVSWVGQSGGHGEVHSTAGGWEVAATYPDLWPSPEHQRRVTDLTRVAETHGGEYTGSGS